MHIFHVIIKWNERQALKVLFNPFSYIFPHEM